MAYTLKDLVRITGAEFRTIQFWTDRGVIKPEVTDTGKGSRRRYSRDEAIVACIIRPFAARQIAVGELLHISDAVRGCLAQGAPSRQMIENIITNAVVGYLIVGTAADGDWRAAIFQQDVDKMDEAAFEAAFEMMGHSVARFLMEMVHEGRPGGMVHAIMLNPELRRLQ